MLSTLCERGGGDCDESGAFIRPGLLVVDRAREIYMLILVV